MVAAEFCVLPQFRARGLSANKKNRMPKSPMAPGEKIPAAHSEDRDAGVEELVKNSKKPLTEEAAVPQARDLPSIHSVASQQRRQNQIDHVWLSGPEAARRGYDRHFVLIGQQQ